MSKIEVKVFPDYMSTGLWINGREESIKQFVDHLPKHLLVALKYWHHTWELMDGSQNMSHWYRGSWWEDGLDIVEEMNKCQSKFEFIYDVACGGVV